MGAAAAGFLSLLVGACGKDVTPGLDPTAEATDGATPPDLRPAPSTDATHATDARDADARDATDVNDARDADAADADDGADAPGEPLCQRPATDVGTRSAACLGRLALGGSSLPYYRSHALDRPHLAIRSLVLVQHGNSRNAWDYYDLVAGAAASRDPDHTAVLAPLFQTFNATCGYDALEPGDLYWGCSDWKQGFPAKNAATDSYQALDALIAAAKVAFPNLERVTVAGYSAGGQTVQRYAAGNVEHDRTPAIATRYVVGSPGSYMYLDGRRVKPDATCSSATRCALDAASFEVPPYAPGCETAEPAVEPGGAAYDEYRYGLAGRTGYLAAIPDATLRANYVARRVVYVLSEGDSTTGPRTAYGALDKECAAVVQAPLGASFRLQRGLVYHRYVTTLLGAPHRLLVVPVCGHEEDCVLGYPGTRDELFGP